MELLQLLFVAICCIWFIPTVSAVGKIRKKKIPSSNSTDIGAIQDIPYEQLSLLQWASLPRETLKLVCTDLHLTTRGDASVLARRIYDHLHGNQLVDPVVSSPSTTAPSSQIQPPITNFSADFPPPIVPNVLQTPSFQRNMSTDLSSQIAELVRNEIQRQVAVVVNPPPVPVQNNIQSAIPSAAVPSVQNIRSQDGAGITTAVSPLRPALINHFNTAVPQLNIHQPAPQLNIFQPTPQLNIRQPAPQLNIHQPAPQLNILQPALQSSQGMNCSPLQHNSSQFNVSHQVLAGDMLPTIPPAQVRKIINREYIDFNALLPDSFSVTPGSYSIEMDPSSQDTTLYLIPRPSQHKIKYFFLGSWLGIIFYVHIVFIMLR